MRLKIALAFTFVSLMQVGCSSGDDGVDISGFYQVQSQSGGQMCAPGTTVAPGAAGAKTHLLVEREHIASAVYYNVLGCTSSDRATCTDYIASVLHMSVENGWTGKTGFSATSGSLCTLGYKKGSAVLEGTTLVVEASSFSDRPASGTPCTLEEANRRAETMPCDGYERFTAIPLGN